MLKQTWLKVFKKHLLQALIISCVLILLVFPDVIFKGASLRLTDQLVSTYYGGHELKAFYPTSSHTRWWSRYNDTGGAVFQSEPMIEFMRRTIEKGDSPYWNPYSAAGSLGPEALVDLKFSPLTLIVSFLHGGSLTYNFIMLLFYGLGTCFMYLTVRRIFLLSPLSATGVGIFYLLNGYSMANVGSNTTQSYLFVPICLYSILSYFTKPNTIRLFWIVPAFFLMLLCTFLPTTIVSLIGIYSVALSLLICRIINKEITFKEGAFLLFTQLIVWVITILLLSLLYFPILENIGSTGLLSDYALRRYFPLKFPNALPWLFSPSLFSESYNFIDSIPKDFMGNTTYHLGISTISLAGCSITLKNNRFTRLTVFCSITILCIFGRLFDAPVLSKMFDVLPIIRSIGNQYWWMAIILPLSILVGFGIQNLQHSNSRITPALFLISLGLISCFIVNDIHGLLEPNLEFKKIALISSAILTLCIFIIISSIRFIKKKWISSVLTAALVCSLFFELTADAKVIRYERNDFLTDGFPPINFLQKEAGLFRTLNFGTTGLYPELGSAFGIQEISSLNEGVISNFREYFYSTFKLDPSQQFGYVDYLSRGTFPSFYGLRDEPQKNSINWQKIDLLGVKFIIFPSSFLNYRKEFIANGFSVAFDSPFTTIVENPTVLSRAFGINIGTLYKNQDIELPEGFRTVITPLEITNYRNTRVEISGAASKPMLVVLTDNWHENWTAKVNQDTVPIMRVNGTFRGIMVPSGDFHIDMTYQPKSLPLAFISTAFTVLILSFTLLKHRRLDVLIKHICPLWGGRLLR